MTDELYMWQYKSEFWPKPLFIVLLYCFIFSVIFLSCRIIVSGPSLAHNVLYNSAGAYRYDSALGLTYDQATDVSDHYPVEVDLVGKGGREKHEQPPSLPPHPRARYVTLIKRIMLQFSF